MEAKPRRARADGAWRKLPHAFSLAGAEQKFHAEIDSLESRFLTYWLVIEGPGLVIQSRKTDGSVV